VGASREPLWPPGFVGSISHSEELVGAAVAATSSARGLGIDFEPIFNEGALRDVAPLAISKGEQRLRRDLPEEAFATTVFSIKESLFKCLFPLARIFFEFDDARVVELTGGGAFRIELLRSLGGDFAAGSLFEGRFAIVGSLVHSGLVLRR
jgi:enterobactin synthetase component D